MVKGLLVAAAAVEILAKSGVKHVVCSPGSRNAPLLVAFDNEKGMEKIVIADERSAAFVALGIAQVSSTPVALVCTSGTAILNYAPAIAEAFYRQIPLIVLSADRPEEWIDQEDSQTIVQPGALSNIVNRTIDIPVCDDSRIDIVSRKVNDAVHSMHYPIAGPVHINIRFENPLPVEDKETIHCEAIELIVGEDSLSKPMIASLAKELAGRKVMLVSGFMQPDYRLNKAVRSFAALPNVVAVYEILANLHLGEYTPPETFVALAQQDPSLNPDIVIVIGGAIVSSALKRYLRGLENVMVWKVGRTRNCIDTFGSLSKRIETNVPHFLTAMAGRLRKISAESDYAQRWKASLDRFKPLSGTEFEENAVSYIVNNIGRETNLLLSNGMTIRNAQNAMTFMPHACYCNRGVSGIEGIISTAVGSSLTYNGNTLLISGDTSYLHDIGALSLRPLMTVRLKMVVINNNGGNIFRKVATTKSLPQREQYFCTRPYLPLEALANAYEMEYFKAEDMPELQREFKAFLNATSPSILEIRVNG